MKSKNWMPFYVADYVAKTLHLTTEEHGAYLLLIAAYWQTERPLADSNQQLATITKMTGSRWGKMRPALEAFFSVSGGVWRHERIDHELEKAKRISQARSAVGRVGGENSSRKRQAIAAPELQAKTNPTNNEQRTEKKEPPLGVPPTDLLGDTLTPAKGNGHAKPAHKPGRRQLPNDWRPDEAGTAFASARDLNLEVELQGFRDHHLARGTLFVRWDAAWRTWCQKAVSFAARDGRRQPGGNRPGAEGMAHAFVRAARR